MIKEGKAYDYNGELVRVLSVEKGIDPNGLYGPCVRFETVDGYRVAAHMHDFDSYATPSSEEFPEVES